MANANETIPSACDRCGRDYDRPREPLTPAKARGESETLCDDCRETSPSHTPGPWRAKEVSTNHVYIIAENGGSVANLYLGSSSWANAHLIAAAPRQNQALHRMVDAIEEMLDDEDLQITSDCGDLLLQIAQIGNAAIRQVAGEAA
jgi:hypothetical protein